MATPSPGDLRNFAIVGHASSGKTTLNEAMLACSGRHRAHGQRVSFNQHHQHDTEREAAGAKLRKQARIVRNILASAFAYV